MGAPKSPEHREKIAAANKGIKRSEETKEKIRQARLGTKLSDEHRAHLAAAARARWARARGEDPEAAYENAGDSKPAGKPHVRVTVQDSTLIADKPGRLAQESIVQRSSTSKASAHKAPRSSLAVTEQQVDVVMPDGRTAAVPHDDPLAEVIRRVNLIRDLGGEPGIKDINEIYAWLDRPPVPPREKPAGSPPELRFIDCQCFAGGFTLGATQAGFTLVHKAEDPAGFGMAICEANRDLLGHWWDGQAAAPADWEVPEHGAQLVVGNPPCSGFSVMSPSSFRGIDSAINECMRHLFAYAARVNPEAVIMESVTSAFKIGLPLMRALAEKLAAETGSKYYVTHVIQNNLSLGGCTRRLRYFLVVTKFPFGVEHEPLRWLPVLGDALSDLRGLPLSWELQPYANAPTWWSHRQRTVSGMVDGHQVPSLTPRYEERLRSITDGADWLPGEPFDAVLKRYYEKHGELPESWRYPSSVKGMEHLTRDKVIIDRDFKVGGYSQTRQWRWDIPGYVVTGHGPTQVWHPDNRYLTHRETARIMGFPDNWVIEPVKDDKNLLPGWGKGISVDCGRWVCTWVRESMLGRPGSITGTKLPDGYDNLIDVSADWKLAPQAAVSVSQNEEEES